MYTHRNFKTKKELKAAVEARMTWEAALAHGVAVKKFLGAGWPAKRPPPQVTYYQPGPYGGDEPKEGTIYVEGPHSPQPHRWYAQCEVRDGQIVKVK